MQHRRIGKLRPMRYQYAAALWLLTGVSGAFVPSAGRTVSLPPSARAWPLSATPRKFQFWALANGKTRAMAHKMGRLPLFLCGIVSISPCQLRLLQFNR